MINSAKWVLASGQLHINIIFTWSNESRPLDFCRILSKLIKINEGFYPSVLAGYHTSKGLWELYPNMGDYGAPNGHRIPTRGFPLDEEVRTVA